MNIATLVIIIIIIIDHHVRTIGRNTEGLLNVCKDIRLAINKGKTKYMKKRYGGMITNEHIRIGSNSHEKVKAFTYLGSLVTNQTCIQDEMKCKLKAGN